MDGHIFVLYALFAILAAVVWFRWKDSYDGNVVDVKDKTGNQGSSLQEQTDTLQRQFKSQISDLMVLFQKENNSIRQELANLNSVLARLEETIVLKEHNDRVVLDLKSTLIDVKRNLSDNNAKQTDELAKLGKILKTNENSFNDQLTALVTKIRSDVNQWQIDNQDALVKAQQDIAKQIENGQRKLNNVNDTLKMIEEAKNEIDTALMVQKDLLSLVYQNTFNKASWTGVILFLYALVVALAIYVKRLSNRSHGNQGLRHTNGVQD